MVDGEGVCVLCGHELETVYHLFISCDFVSELWERVIRREGIVWARPGNLLGLMQQWEELRVTSARELWALIPYSMLWTVWMERNAVVFHGKAAVLDQVWDSHLTKIYWWVKGSNLECSYSLYDFVQHFDKVGVEILRKQPRLAVWCPPERGVLKFNVDGAARGTPGRGGIGGVERDWSGEVRGYFSKSVGVVYAYEAEVLAIRHALDFCKDFNLRHVCLESDSTLAIGWTLCSANRPWKLLNELQAIDFLREEVDCFKVVHVWREANDRADALAKEGVEREQQPLWVYGA